MEECGPTSSFGTTYEKQLHLESVRVETVRSRSTSSGCWRVSLSVVMRLMRQAVQQAKLKYLETGFQEIWKLVSKEEYDSPVDRWRRQAPIFRQRGQTFGSWSPYLLGSGKARSKSGSVGFSLNSPLSATAK